MDKTTETEILIISAAFNIPAENIKSVLEGPPKIKRVIKKAKPGKQLLNLENLEKPETTKAKKNSLSFSDFDEAYIKAINQTEEIGVIEKFLPICSDTKHAKVLYEVCPENQELLKNKILYRWVDLSSDMAHLREVKPLTKKDTPAAELAYKKYLLFF